MGDEAFDETENADWDDEGERDEGDEGGFDALGANEGYIGVDRPLLNFDYSELQRLDRPADLAQLIVKWVRRTTSFEDRLEACVAADKRKARDLGITDVQWACPKTVCVVVYPESYSF